MLDSQPRCEVRSDVVNEGMGLNGNEIVVLPVDVMIPNKRER
jgi:hypothetical protein